MYLRGLASWDSEDAIDENVIYLPPDMTGGPIASAPWPQAAATGLDRYAGLLTQGIAAYTTIHTADLKAQSDQALIARGILPPGYAATVRPPIASQPVRYSPFQTGAPGGIFTDTNLLLMLAALGIAGYIAFGK